MSRLTLSVDCHVAEHVAIGRLSRLLVSPRLLVHLGLLVLREIGLELLLLSRRRLHLVHLVRLLHSAHGVGHEARCLRWLLSGLLGSLVEIAELVLSLSSLLLLLLVQVHAREHVASRWLGRSRLVAAASHVHAREHIATAWSLGRLRRLIEEVQARDSSAGSCRLRGIQFEQTRTSSGTPRIGCRFRTSGRCSSLLF